MTNDSKIMLACLLFSTLFSSASFAHQPLSYGHLPLSYSELIRAERERMQALKASDSQAYPADRVRDESWLLNTPATWGYIINSEKLRMKQSLPHTSVSSPSPRHQTPNLMPTTWNEGVRLQHEQMKQNYKATN